MKDIEKTLAEAAARGAKTLRGKTEIGGGHGFCAEMEAPDGNVFGLWSMT